MTDRQCPTCGRVSEDWSTPKGDGSIKSQQRKDSEDRTIAYQQWRRTHLRHGCYGSDIDTIEWRIVDGEPVPVAMMELSRVDGNVKPPPSYFEAVIARFTKRDGQAFAARAFARLLGVHVWIVLFRWDMTELWIYNLSEPDGWFHLNPTNYGKWIESLQPREAP